MVKMIKAWEQFMPKARKELLMKYTEVPLETGVFMNGDLCRILENELKRLFDVKNVFVTGSGTDAYELLLALFMNQTGREKLTVIAPLYSFISDWSVPESMGILTLICNNPIIPIDVHEVKPIRRLLSERDLVIVPAWMHGYYNEKVEGFVEGEFRADSVVNDFAHCLGSGRLNGDYGFVSFAPTKIVGSGKGGALLNNLGDCDLGALRDFGRDVNGQEQYKYGKNFKMSEFDAAVVLSGLPFLNEIVERQKHVFEYYNKELEPFENEGVISCLDKWMKGWRRNYYQYCVLLNGKLCGRRRLIEDRMLEEGVECWRKQNPQFHDRIFLPCHANLTEKDLEKVVDVFSEVIYEVIEGE